MVRLINAWNLRLQEATLMRTLSSEESHPHLLVFAPEFMSSDYVRVTQLYCDGVVSIFLNSLFLGLIAPPARS